MKKLTIAALCSFLLTACAGGPGAAKAYPLDTCIVSDNKLGSMGDPVTIVHEGQAVKFCCKPCVKKFRENPAKFLGKLQR